MRLSRKIIIIAMAFLSLATVAFAAYTILVFNGTGKGTEDAGKISGVQTALATANGEIVDLKNVLSTTLTSLQGERGEHKTDVDAANTQITNANDYYAAVSSALTTVDGDVEDASSAISTANSVVNAQPTDPDYYGDGAIVSGN
ncbi:MAG TPA: hypothetical protein VGM95_00130 [Lactobacillaceae bacterium]|jgi:hypothetical protein